MPQTKKPIPRPNVIPKKGSKSGATETDVRAIFCNPVYAGLAMYPPIVDDDTWVRAAAKAIQEDGAEQWLVNMLYVLRSALGGVKDS